MKKIKFLVLLLIVLSSKVFAEEITINVEKENLTQFILGNEDYINVSVKGEDYNGFLGIAVTEYGKLIIPTSIKNNNGENIIYEYNENKLVKTEKYKMNLNSFFPISQDGLIQIPGEIFYFTDSGVSKLNYTDLIDYDLLPDRIYNNCYVFKKGLVFEKQAVRQRNKKNIAVELEKKKFGKVLTDFEEINKWIKEQNPSFSIDEDAVLLKNGNFFWSINRGENDGEFIGKIKNGFNLFEFKNEEFYITDSNGIKVLSMPIKENKLYSLGVGTWGEIYMLLIPELIEKGKETFFAKEGEKAELVVIRNHLKYFGILNDNNIRLRKGPGTDTESLGTYPVKTGFRILEDSGVKQTIDGQTYTWIKVRLLDGTEGYFYGQYVQNLYDGPGTPLPWPNVADWD